MCGFHSTGEGARNTTPRVTACVTIGFSHRLAEGSICYQEVTWVIYGWQMLSEGAMDQDALLWGFSIGL